MCIFNYDSFVTVIYKDNVIFRLNSKLKMPFKGQKYNCLLHIVPPQTCLSVILDIAS